MSSANRRGEQLARHSESLSLVRRQRNPGGATQPVTLSSPLNNCSLRLTYHRLDLNWTTADGPDDGESAGVMTVDTFAVRDRGLDRMLVLSEGL